MNKKSILCINKYLPAICEDIYLCDRRGNVIVARERLVDKITNIFACIDPRDLNFLNGELNSYPSSPFALVNSKIGGLLVDVSAFASLGTLLVIATNLEAVDVLCAAETHLRGELTVAPSLSLSCDHREPSNESLVLINKLKPLYTLLAQPHIGAHSVSYEALEALNVIRFFSEVCACSVQVSVRASDVAELENELCIARLCASLACFFTVAHKYSAQRLAEIEVISDAVGVRIECSFDAAEQFSENGLFDIPKELLAFIKNADEHFFMCQCRSHEKRITLSAFPWKVKALSSDLKKDKTDIE